jgi:thiamine-phosphate pyrophosphorylase
MCAGRFPGLDWWTRSSPRRRSGGGLWPLSNGTERRIFCYITDRIGLGADSGGAAGAQLEVARVARLLERIRWAIDGGVDWIQIREKDLGAAQLAEIARGAVAAARGNERRSRVIVNERLDVAVAAGAGGVHLGRESLPVREAVAWREKEKIARTDLADFLIGASCHSLEDARAAASDAADYLIFGPVFETPSKMKFGAPLGVERLREVCRDTRIPVLAIGGIDSANAAKCFEAGAAGIAAIRLFQDAKTAKELRTRAEALRVL